CHNRSMSLLAPADQDKLRDAFKEIARPVRLLFFTQAFGCETCAETRQILDELPALSDNITVEEVNLVLDRETAGRYGIDRAPAVAVVGQNEAGGRHGDEPRAGGGARGADRAGGADRFAHPLPWRAVRLRVRVAGAGGPARPRPRVPAVRRPAANEPPHRAA